MGWGPLPWPCSRLGAGKLHDTSHHSSQTAVLLSVPLKQALALVILSCLLWLPGFTALPVVDRDEARYAQATKQMVQTGDYIDIRFQDEARHKKPVGIYWLQSVSVKLTGVSDEIWAYRLPSLLAAMAAVLMTARMAAGLFGPPVFLPVGVLLAGCFLLGVGARVATTDAALLVSVLAAQWMLGKAYLKSFSPSALVNTAQAAIFWIAIAVGALIKGPVILAIMGLTVLALCVLSRSWRWLLHLRPIWGVPLFLAVLLPWFVAITLKSDGGFWVESFQKDILSKAVSVQESHGAPPGAYVVSLLLTFWPWTALLIPAAFTAFQQRKNPAVQLCLAWLVPAWLMFELAPTKLPHYVLPLFPPLVALVALTLRDWAQLPAWLRRGTVVLWVVLVAAVGAGMAVAPQAVGGAWSPWVMGATGLLVVVLCVALLRHSARPQTAMTQTAMNHAVLWAGGALVAFQVAFWQFTLPDLEQPWLSRTAAQLIAPYRAQCPGPVLSAGFEEPSLVFTLGTDTRLGAGRMPQLSVASCHLLLVDAHAWASVTAQLNGRVMVTLASADGYNYSTNEKAQLTLYRLEPAQQ